MEKRKRKDKKQRRRRRSFDDAFKVEAGCLCKVGDRSIAQVARDLDLSAAGDRGPPPKASVERTCAT